MNNSNTTSPPPPYSHHRSNNSELPDYFINASIVEKINDEKKDIIKFYLSEQHKEKTYQLGDVIAGDLVICPIEDIPIDHLIIDFMVIESTTTTDGQRMPRVIRKTTISQNWIPRACFPAGRILKFGFEYTFPFSILIPYTLPPTACGQSNHPDMHALLPPSLGAPFDYSLALNHPDDLPDACARITYGLRCRVLKRSIKVNEFFRPIHLIPSYPLDDFVPDYYSGDHTASKSIKRGILRRTELGQCSISVSEPSSSLKISPNHPAVLELVINFTPSIHHHLECPPTIHKITYRVKSYTYITPSKLKKPPKTSLDRTIKPISQTICKRKYEMQQLRWSKNRDYSTALAHLPLYLPDSVSQILPTFSTCLITRYYEVEVRLYMDPHSSTESICINVPLVVLLNHTQSILPPSPPLGPIVNPISSNNTNNDDDDGRRDSITKRAINNNAITPCILEE